MEDGIVLAVSDEHKYYVCGPEESSVGDGSVVVPYDAFAMEV